MPELQQKTVRRNGSRSFVGQRFDLMESLAGFGEARLAQKGLLVFRDGGGEIAKVSLTLAEVEVGRGVVRLEAKPIALRRKSCLRRNCSRAWACYEAGAPIPSTRSRRRSMR